MNSKSGTPHARAFDLPGWPCPPRVRDIPSQETVICKHDPNNPGEFLLVLKLDGVSMNIDNGSLMAQTTTALLIDGVKYLPMHSVVSITSTEQGNAISTTIVVIPDRT